MPIRRYKPTSPGRRFMSVSTFEEITKTKPEKSLLEPVTKKGGRNNNGRITTRHQGGGHKRRFRIIDFKRTKDGIPAKVAAIEYDPNRSAQHRAAALRGRREVVHPRARAVAGRLLGRVRPRCGHQGRQRASAREHPDRHARAQRRAEAGAGREDGALRRLGHPARGEGRPACGAPASVGRDAPRPSDLPRDGRSGRQRRPPEHQLGQGRAAAAGRASARPCAARR